MEAGRISCFPLWEHMGTLPLILSDELAMVALLREWLKNNWSCFSHEGIPTGTISYITVAG